MLEQLTNRLGSRRLSAPKISAPITRCLRLGVALVMATALIFGPMQSAEAASSMGGGRMGGGSFRAPARTYSAPRSTYSRGGYNRGYGGGGIGMPFIFPFFGGFGMGGGLVTLLMVIVVANFLMQALQTTQENRAEAAATNPNVSVAKLQVGLLAEAKQLKTELNQLAIKANTSTNAGLANVLQETTLALLRHPEYWAYAGDSVEQTKLVAAENQFNRLALQERSKFTRETLSNVGGQLKQLDASSIPSSGAISVAQPSGALAATPAINIGEYIVVTLLVAAQGNLTLPKITNTTDLRQALQQLGGVGSDRLMALEVLWTPQAEADVLTGDEMVAEYPDLKLI